MDEEKLEETSQPRVPPSGTSSAEEKTPPVSTPELSSASSCSSSGQVLSDPVSGSFIPAPPPPAPASVTSARASTSRPKAKDKAEVEAELLAAKLVNILKSVKSEESKLKQKLRAEQNRLKTIADTLCKASDVRSQLQAFDPLRDAHRKHQINLLLDGLDDSLNTLNEVEKEMQAVVCVKMRKEFAEKLTVEREKVAVEMSAIESNYESRVGKLFAQTQEFKDKSETLIEENALLSAENEKMEKQLSDFQEDFDNLKSRTDEMKQEIEANESLREEWQKQKRAKNEELLRLRNSVAELTQANERLRHTSTETDMERQRVADESLQLKELLAMTQQSRDVFEKELESVQKSKELLLKEKSVLIKEVKSLRSQRTQLIEVKEEIVSALKARHSQFAKELNTAWGKRLEEKEELLQRCAQREETVLGLVKDLLAKMSSLDMTLMNATVTVLKDTTPDMSDSERIVKSTELIRQLAPLFSEATSQMDDMLLSSAMRKRSDGTALDLTQEEMDRVQAHDLVIRQLSQMCMELLCDKMTFVQRLNEMELKILKLTTASAASGSRGSAWSKSLSFKRL